MNVNLKKINILEPKVKINTGVKIITLEKKGFDFTDMSGIVLPFFQNNMNMITGTIIEEV